MPPDTLDIALIHPELLGLYGDRGNALVLERRAEARGIAARIVEVTIGQAVPATADLYLLGGAEDAAMLTAHELLRADGGLQRALARGAPCLAVCAGFQLLSEEFVGPDGRARTGLGVLDARCGRLDGPRAVGEVVTASELVGGLLTGFENHQGSARLGTASRPLGVLRVGTGNGDGLSEGAVQGSVVATYLHGPVLVRNPDLADHLLGRALGEPLPAVIDPLVARLRRERLRAADPAGLRRRYRRIRARLGGGGAGFPG
jgi:CobQ-like glutamine amidotransferase family enzyme